MKKVSLKIKTYSHNKELLPFFKNRNLELIGDGITFLIGMSGSGKTTLLKILLNMEKGIFKGNVDYYYDNKKYKIIDLFKKGDIGFMSQNPNLISWKNIRENLILPFTLNNSLKSPKDDTINYLIIKTGLSLEILHQYPHELSYGMQLRVSFIRLLLHKPKFIFLDEFFTGIDEINKKLLYKVLNEYVKTHKILCLAITHALDEILKIGNQILILTNNSKEILKLNSKTNKSIILKKLKK